MHDQAAQARAALAGGADRGEEHAAHDEVEVGARSHDGGVVAAELEQRASEPARRCAVRSPFPSAVEPVAETSGTRAIVGELHGTVGAADDELEEAVRDVAEALGCAREQRRARERGQRRPLGRLPDHRVAADEGERGVPAPDRDREVEGADHGHGPERVPRLGEPMPGSLGGDRAAVELAREADREVADVDHLLHLAEALLRDLPDLERDERAERVLLAAELLAEQAHELAAPRRRHVAPGRRRRRRRGRRRRRCRRRRCARPGRSPRR